MIPEQAIDADYKKGLGGKPTLPSVHGSAHAVAADSVGFFTSSLDNFGGLYGVLSPIGEKLHAVIKGFKDFILRGNVVDLAVGVVIGAAFNNVVTAFTRAFLDPLIRLATGGSGEVAGKFMVNGVPFDWGSFVTALINFLLTAAVLYFFVVAPMNKAVERLKRSEKPAVAEPSNEEKLLAEIRDAVKSRPL